jgi:hypothetical protein
MCAMKQQYVLPFLTLCALLTVRSAPAQCGFDTAPGTAATGADNGAIGTLQWSNTGATTMADGNSATAGAVLGALSTATSHYLTLDGFGFNVPGTYTICGVGVNITRYTGTLLSLGYIADNVVQLATINGAAAPSLLGSNQALTGYSNAWPVSSGTATYGGSGNTMGATLTGANVSAANFGVVISASYATFLSVGLYANVDYVSMSIYTPLMVLPITLGNFTATGNGHGNTISWTADADDIANQFVVQRSADGDNWQNIATFSAITGTESYSYTDANPLAGPNYYRLELINTDGTTGYSLTAIVATKSITPGSIQFYPNPFQNMINITAKGAFTRVSLTDMAGRTLWVKEYPGGVNSTQIPAGELSQGLYFVSVDGTTYKLIKN